MRDLREGSGGRPAAQPRQQRERAAIRAEPSARQGDDRRRHPADSRLHAMPARWKSDQSRLIRQAISSAGAPKAIGPYSQAVRAGQLLFLSGQVPLDPATGALVDGDIPAQTRRVFENLHALLKAGGLSFDDVVRTTVFLADLNDFAA